jgi:O-antigen/teichoic acid export membrane protein
MGKVKKLLSNTVIFAAGTFASKLLVYFLMPLYTSILTKPESSVADFIQQTGNLLMPLFALGICDGLLRFAMDAGERKRGIFSTSVAVIAAGSVLVLCAIPLLDAADGRTGMFGGQAWLVAVFVVAANFQMAASYYVRSLGHTAVYAAQGIINTALTIIFNLIFLVRLDMGVTGFILAVTFANAAVTLILVFWMRLWRDFDPRLISRGTLSELLKYSIPLIPTTVMWTVTSLTDRYIVRVFAGDYVNGLFVWAYKIPTLLTLITTVFIEAWQLSAVTDATEEEKGPFFTKVFRSYSGLIFMTASVLIATSQIFTRLLLADSYYLAWIFIPVLIVATVFSAFATFAGTVYMVRKKSVAAFLTAFAGAAINIGLSLLLAPSLKIWGVAGATVVSYVAVFAIRAATARKYVNFSLGIPRMAVNGIAVAAQAVLMTLQLPSGLIPGTSIPLWIPVQAVFVVVLFVYNGRPMLEGIIPVIRERLGRAGGKKEE